MKKLEFLSGKGHSGRDTISCQIELEYDTNIDGQPVQDMLSADFTITDNHHRTTLDFDVCFLRDWGEEYTPEARIEKMENFHRLWTEFRKEFYNQLHKRNKELGNTVSEMPSLEEIAKELRE